MSAGSYLLVRFDDRSKLAPAATALDKMKAVSHWDAVDGYYSLVVHTDDKVTAGVIEKLDGFAELARCQSISTGQEKDINPEKASSYVLAEIDSGKADDVCRTLGDNPQVGWCVSCKGDYDLVAVVAGENFDEVDRVVDRDIRQLDGVLRLKQGRIIYLDRM